jgi:hypothetical protein
MARADGRVFASDAMTSRGRLLAAYRGEAVDRLPYWAKVCNSTWRLSQPQRVRSWSDRDLLDYIHADGIFHVDRCVRRIAPHVTEESRQDGAVRTRTMHTPDGDLAEQQTVDPLTQSWHPSQFPVKTPQDIRRYLWLHRDVKLEIDERALAQATARVARIGDRGIAKTAWGTSPLMHLVEHVIGLVHTVHFLADHGDEMDELIETMHRANVQMAAFVAEHTPADVVVSVENTSTTLISPEQFDRYCRRHLCDYGKAIEDAGKMHELHMCGHLSALLERIETIPAASVEALSCPPLANTRLVDGRTRAPGKTLVGGTCVNVWLMPPAEIERFIEGELDACPNHRRIVLTTAGVAPPACAAETFRAVGEWIRSLPVRM